jgi:hypothetical protein
MQNWDMMDIKYYKTGKQLVGGLEHEFYFPYIGNHNPN